VYASAAVDAPEGSPEFYNAVVVADSMLTPQMLLERALALFERVADTSFELHVRQSLASIHFQQGHVAQARDLADRTIVRAAEVGDEHWGAVAQVVRARVLLTRRRRRRSEACRAAGRARPRLRSATRSSAPTPCASSRSQARRAVRPPRRTGRSSSPSSCSRRSTTRADLAQAASEYAKVLRARGSIDEAFAMLELAHTRR